MCLPDFDKYRRTDVGDNDLDGGLSDGFDDGFDDDFDGGFSNGFDDGFNNGRQDDMPDYHDGGEIPDEHLNGAAGESPEKQLNQRDTTDLKAGFRALFKAVTDRFTGKGGHTRQSSVDGSDALFAHEFDSAVDEGFAVPPDETEKPVMPEAQLQPDYSDSVGNYTDWAREDAGQPSDEAYRPERHYAGYNYDYMGERRTELNNSDDGSNIFDFQDDRGYGDFSDNRAFADDNMFDKGDIYEVYRENGDISGDGLSAGEEQDKNNEELPPEGSIQGLFAAIADGFAKFRWRLPSFRPKVYVIPEPEYHPEQDGIGTPTLASDIRKMIEEQNRPGETEIEYDRMRKYISTVSTDTRIRPGDIKAPRNIDEIRAAESELYDLIDAISNTNEQQRSRIGVYEKPPEEDPYNFRGINNARQFYTDMDRYSFDMNSRYGFESEEKVDPGRKAAEAEYNRMYNQTMAQDPDGYSETADSFGDGFDDDFNDDFDDDFGNGFNDGFSDDFDDDSGITDGDGLSDDFDDTYGGDVDMR